MATSAHESTRHESTTHDVAEQKSFGAPDETRTFGHGQVDLLRIGGAEVGRLTLQPGWRWSQDVKPLAGTDLCEAPHFQYHVAGTLRIVMSDGTTFDAVSGDVTALPQGHDAWVIGDEPVVVVDWWGASNYAKA
ncbi:MAG TPA: cupin domain-containing protein [Candidatus Nanopelagicales bacterium]